MWPLASCHWEESCWKWRVASSVGGGLVVGYGASEDGAEGSRWLDFYLPFSNARWSSSSWCFASIRLSWWRRKCGDTVIWMLLGSVWSCSYLRLRHRVDIIHGRRAGHSAPSCHVSLGPFFLLPMSHMGGSSLTSVRCSTYLLPQVA
jgi:hypothetical protein